MRFHVLGVGSVGSLVAHHLRLSQPKADVCLVVRNANKFSKGTLLRKNPDSVHGIELRVTRRGGDTEVSGGYELDVSNRKKVEGLVTAGLEGLVPRVNTDAPIDSLIVCTKAPATADAISGLRDRIAPTSVIALLQNGMGVYDELCDKFWPDAATRPQFVLGTTTHGVTGSPTPGDIMHNTRPGEGAVKWGVVPDPRGFDVEQWLWGRRVGHLPPLTPPDSPSLPLPPPPRDAGLDNLHATLTALLSMSALSPSLLPMPHLYNQLLLKLAVNAAINPLTAVLGGGYMTNGMLLLRDPSFRNYRAPGRDLIRQVTVENSKVLTAYLHTLAGGVQPASPDLLRQFSPGALTKAVTAVTRSTDANTSSMATDVKHGSETEVKYINGFIMSLGTRLRIPTPVNRMLISMVDFKTAMGRFTNTLPQALVDGMRNREKGLQEYRDLVLEERKMALAERKMALEEQETRVAIAKDRKLQRRDSKAYDTDEWTETDGEVEGAVEVEVEVEGASAGEVAERASESGEKNIGSGVEAVAEAAAEAKPTGSESGSGSGDEGAKCGAAQGAVVGERGGGDTTTTTTTTKTV